MGSIPNGSAPLQACARQNFYSRFRAALGRRKLVSNYNIAYHKTFLFFVFIAFWTTSSLTAGVGPGIVVVSGHLLSCWDEGEREGQQHAP